MIRRFEPRDFEVVIELHHLGLDQTGANAGPGSWDDDLLSSGSIIATYVTAGGDFVVGTIDDQAVAMGALRPSGQGRAEIKRMRVHPDHQRRGHGQAIPAYLEARAKEQRESILHLDTTTLQEAAMAFYAKNGFREKHREERDGFEVVTFEKSLRDEPEF